MRREHRLVDSPAADLLAPGRAPACWRREIARLNTRQKSLARACAWLDEIVHRPSPRLQVRPLLGACLAEIAAELSGSPSPEQEQAPPHGRAEEATRAGRSRHVARGRRSPRRRGGAPEGTGVHRPAISPLPSQSGGGGERRLGKFRSPSRPNQTATYRSSGAAGKRLTATEGGESPSGAGSREGDERPATKKRPFSFPPQATRQLLTRLSGRHPSPAGARSTSSPAKSRPPLRSRQVDELPLSPSGDAPVAGRANASPPDDPQSWGTGVAERARRRLRRYQAETAVPSHHPVSSSPPELPPAPRLEGQWQRPFAKPAITAEKLLALYRPSPARPATDSRRKKNAPPAADAPQPRPRADTVEQPAQEREAPQGKLRQAAQERHNAQFTIPRSQFSEESGTPLIDEEGTPLSPDLAPPQLAATLTSLRSRPAASPIPAASATAERNARRETAVTAPEALHDLANKIKQILDEESRRHGIDV